MLGVLTWVTLAKVTQSLTPLVRILAGLHTSAFFLPLNLRTSTIWANIVASRSRCTASASLVLLNVRSSSAVCRCTSGGCDIGVAWSSQVASGYPCFLRCIW